MLRSNHLGQQLSGETTIDSTPHSASETYFYNVQSKHPTTHGRQASQIQIMYDGVDVYITETGSNTIGSGVADFVNFTASVTTTAANGEIVLKANHNVATAQAAELQLVRTYFD